MIDEHAGQAVTNCALHERCRHRGVNAAGQATDGMAIGADLLGNSVDKLLCDI